MSSEAKRNITKLKTLLEQKLNYVDVLFFIYYPLRINSLFESQAHVKSSLQNKIQARKPLLLLGTEK